MRKPADKEYPVGTAKILSWSAMRFIEAPSSRLAAFAVATICVCLVVAGVLASLIQMDVGVEALGEVDTSFGTREVLSVGEGVLGTFEKQPGDKVDEGERIALIHAPGTSRGVNESVVNAARMALSNATLKLSTAELSEKIDISPAIVSLHALASVQIEKAMEAVETAVRSYNRQAGALERKVGSLTRKLAALQSSSAIGQSSYEARPSTGNDEVAGEVLRAYEVLDLSIKSYMQQHSVISPVKGTVAKHLVGPNTALSSGRAVALVIPQGSRYIASLRVPSNNIARIRIGQKVYFKIDAFPSQSYGVFLGEVVSLEDIRDNSGGASQEDAYLVKASLEAPTGLSEEAKATIRLLVGMRMKAQIVIERKSILKIVQEKMLQAAL